MSADFIILLRSNLAELLHVVTAPFKLFAVEHSPSFTRYILHFANDILSYLAVINAALHIDVLCLFPLGDEACKVTFVVGTRQGVAGQKLGVKQLIPTFFSKDSVLPHHFVPVIKVRLLLLKSFQLFLTEALKFGLTLFLGNASVLCFYSESFRLDGFQSKALGFKLHCK
jgi:hypothetical protein